MMQKKTAYFVVTVLLLSSLAFGFSLSPSLSETSSPSVNLESSQTYLGLPVAEVKSYKTENSQGTVIFIPQYHKNPGSSATDKKNDSATVAQEQIYQILNFLVDKVDLRLIVTEGELAGEVPVEKVAGLAQKIALRNECMTLLSSLKAELGREHLDPKEEQRLYQKLNTALDAVNREIILEGAPLKLKAEGKDFNLVGSENEQTRAESKVLVRNYIYLEDRINQLENHHQKKEVAFRPLGASYDQLLQLLLAGRDDSSTAAEFASLTKKAELLGKDSLKGLLQKTEQAFSLLQGPKRENSLLRANLGLLNQSESQAPSREDNPYQNITSRSQLQKMMGEAEAQIDEVVVERRNRETAQNFAQALREEKLNIGILQFGAGHEEGLIAQLQRQGLSVIVVKPNEVVSRNSGA